jgi:hypothetical protein
MKIIILGGYGVFGGRLIELLSDCPDLEIWVAGRTASKGAAYCAAYTGQSKLHPLCVDRVDIAPHLSAIKPALIVDASGPFQDYGDTPYIVAQAAIDAGVNYLDLSDGAEFSIGIDRLNAGAKTANTFVLSAISTFPVLTGAAFREIQKRITVETLVGGIAPSPFAGIGLNVMRAALGYAGEDIKITRNGISTTAKALCESTRITIAPAGKIPLRNIHFSLVETPDLQILPNLHPNLRDIWIGAGTVPELLHKCLNLSAKLRAKRLVPNLMRFAKPFYWVLNRAKFGEDRGGLFLRATGEGKTIEFHLLAEGRDGPMIPSMAAEAIIRKMQNGVKIPTGARIAQTEITLDDYANLVQNRDVFFNFREHKSGSIFPSLLEDSYAQLPPQVCEFHAQETSFEWAGRAQVTRGTGILSRAIATVFRFPNAGADIPVSVQVDVTQQGEKWTRNFAGRKFISHLSRGVGRDDYLMLERFGPVTVALAMEVRDDRLYFIPRHWRIFGIPLPKFLLPAGDSFETQEKGRFHFDVKLALPIVGLIAAYRGWLAPINSD